MYLQTDEKAVPDVRLDPSSHAADLDKRLSAQHLLNDSCTSVRRYLILFEVLLLLLLIIRIIIITATPLFALGSVRAGGVAVTAFVSVAARHSTISVLLADIAGATVSASTMRSRCTCQSPSNDRQYKSNWQPAGTYSTHSSLVVHALPSRHVQYLSPLSHSSDAGLVSRNPLEVSMVSLRR
jgi:hypothetical protein